MPQGSFSFRSTIMRLLIQFWFLFAWFVFLNSAHMHVDYTITNDARMHGSCMINTNNFNRSCIYDKVVYLARKLPFVSKWSMAQMGPLELVKLPNYATGITSVLGEVPHSRSYSDNVISLISKGVEYFLNSYGFKIRLPPQSKNFPAIVVEDLSNDTISNDENESRRHKHKKEAKRFALIFPLIATFKFILIKALLVPILLGIIAIKKMLVMAALAVPMVFTMLRLCRWGGFGFGPLTAAAGAATAPVMAAPYGVASDMYIGEFANNIPSLMPAAHQAYHNKQAAGDYGGKSLSSFNPFGNLNNYQ